MTDTTVRRMTTEEIALMREIVRWRRNHDVQMRWWPTLCWINAKSGQAVYRDGWEFATCPDYHNGPITWHRVVSLVQAIDVLVALEYLPQRFSSAYRAGWEARWGDENDHGWTDDQFAQVAPAVKA